MELYCFSCTGNTRRAADITREICERSNLFAALFPVHAQGIPRLARRQLEALPPMSGPACVICTYGGVSPGAALSQGAAILTRKGLTVLAAAELPDRHSYDRATGGGGLVLPRRWEQEELERFLRAVMAKARAGDVVQWCVMGIAWLSIPAGAPLWLTLAAVGVFLLYSVLSLAFMIRLEKEM